MVQITTQQGNVELLKIKNQFTAEIEFGVLRQQCRNFGICKINPLRWKNIDPDKQNLVVVTLLENHYLELVFFKTFLAPAAYQKFFSKGVFLIEENYQFVSPKKEEYNFSIAKGKYPIQESAGMLTIVFPAT